MGNIRITRRVTIPDTLKISRYRKVPELGPSILFFSGGSALTHISRTLKNYTHNSIHLVTPFDSGGSSAKLRKAFQMPSIGDLRSRMIALADESVTGHPEIYRLFTHRLPKEGQDRELREQLIELARGSHPLVADIPNPMRRLIRTQLGFLLDAMPADFDLRGASIGNLILAGGYLNNGEHLDPIIFLFSKLVNVQGTVRAVVDDNLHLGARLEDGSEVIGQHRLTGKEVPPLNSPIESLFLSRNPDRRTPARSELPKHNRRLIESADLICYPPGSFHTSILANLLPKGVTSAIASNDCPKVYVPNLGTDPEQLGMDMDQLVTRLLKQLRTGAGKGVRNQRLLNFVLIDGRNGRYVGRLSPSRMKKLGIEVIDTCLVSRDSAPYYDGELLVSALLSLTC
jgi:CofD-related protein of GAK system